MRASLALFVGCGALAIACGGGTGTGPVIPGAGGSPAPATGGSGGTGGTGGATTGGSGGELGPDAAAGTGGAGGTGGTGPDAAPADDTAPPPQGDGGAVPPATGGGFPLCPNCKSIFDGTTLNGWEGDPATGGFEVKDQAIASTGKVAGGQGGNLWTKDDYGDYRVFFTVRHLAGGHRPCTTIFNSRPANGKSARGLDGIQFQPPAGGSWDYRPGHPGDPTGRSEWMYPTPRPMFDPAKWNRCEILVKASGEFRAACCQIEGVDSCKAVEVLHFNDPTAGKKGPFNIMIHNAGLLDEYKDIWIETDPTVDDLLSTK